MIKKAIITAAGFGSRFLPITKTFPKELLPIVDKPVIQYLVEECAEAGIQEVIIVASPTEVDKFENYFYGRATSIRSLMIRQNKLERWNKVEKVFELPQITVIPQDDRLPYGNGRPILSAKDLLLHDEAFVVMFGDDMVVSKISAVKQLIDFYKKNKADGILQVTKLPPEDLIKGGVVTIKKGTLNRVEGVIEKPSLDELPSDLFSYGRFILTPKIFDYLKSDSLGKDNELWLQDANSLLAKKGKVLVQVLDGNFVTTGDPLNFLKATIKVALDREDLKKEFKKYLEETIQKL